MVSLGDAQLPESEKRLICRAVERQLQGQSDLLPIELSKEASSWVRRDPANDWAFQSALPVYEQSVDGVVVDRVQSENVVQLGLHWWLWRHGSTLA
jgi:hypothetical protein